MNIQAVDLGRETKSEPQAANCRLCGSRLKHTFVDLGMSPPCESFLQAAKSIRWSRTSRCTCWSATSCFLVQLQGVCQPRSRSSREYAYFSSYLDDLG